MLAGTNQTDVLTIQVPAALAAGELDEEALREITILVCHYAGWPIGSRVNQVVEESIARHRQVVSGVFIEPAVGHASPDGRASSDVEALDGPSEPRSSARPGPDLAAHGYAETEYVVRGTAVVVRRRAAR